MCWPCRLNTPYNRSHGNDSSNGTKRTSIGPTLFHPKKSKANNGQSTEVILSCVYALLSLTIPLALYYYLFLFDCSSVNTTDALLALFSTTSHHLTLQFLQIQDRLSIILNLIVSSPPAHLPLVFTFS